MNMAHYSLAAPYSEVLLGCCFYEQLPRLLTPVTVTRNCVIET